MTTVSLHDANRVLPRALKTLGALVPVHDLCASWPREHEDDPHAAYSEESGWVIRCGLMDPPSETVALALPDTVDGVPVWYAMVIMARFERANG